MTNAQESTPRHSRGFIYFLIITALACGALVMVIEVLGSRVIGPFFGVSLFVWTSLITVTLVALALGYATGGIVSDRRESPDYLYGIIFLAGVFALLIPLSKGMVLKACQPLGLRLGTFVSALLLFGPSLFFLGCVSPYLIKISAREMRNIGRTVGIFYAVSTVGSFVGTIVTGFVLIAYFRVNQIFFFTGLMLVLLSVSYAALFRQRWYAFAVLAAVPLFFPVEHGVVAKVMPNGTSVSRIHSRDSFYGSIKVVDYAFNDIRTRELIIDGFIQGGIDLGNRMSVYEYSYLMQYIPRAINPRGKACLIIGLGAGVVPMWYEAQGVRTDVVDIDPAIVETARDYFGFSVRGDIFVDDARHFLGVSTGKYDYIVLDVFNGDTTPGHLLSREAVRLLKERMEQRGVLAINLIGSLKESTFMTASVIRTLETEFAVVDVYPTFDPSAGDGTGNLAIFAYDTASAPLDIEAIKAKPLHRLVAEGIRGLPLAKFRFPEGVPALVLSDDYNPIDFYDSWLKERVRADILKSTDWDILI